MRPLIVITSRYLIAVSHARTGPYWEASRILINHELLPSKSSVWGMGTYQLIDSGSPGTSRWAAYEHQWWDKLDPRLRVLLTWQLYTLSQGLRVAHKSEECLHASAIKYQEASFEVQGWLHTYVWQDIHSYLVDQRVDQCLIHQLSHSGLQSSGWEART